MTDEQLRRSSRELIWEAANELFPKRGYADTSVREIARAAGVDAALVIRHFESKEQLFLQTMTVRITHRPIADVAIDKVGEHFIRFVLSVEDEVREVFVALVRASGTSGVNTRLRDIHDSTFVAPLRARLSGPDVELRTRLAAALVGGLLYELWVVGDDVLAASDPDQIVAHYGPLLQQLITPAN